MSPGVVAKAASPAAPAPAESDVIDLLDSSSDEEEEDHNKEKNNEWKDQRHTSSSTTTTVTSQPPANNSIHIHIHSHNNNTTRGTITTTTTAFTMGNSMTSGGGVGGGDQQPSSFFGTLVSQPPVQQDVSQIPATNNNNNSTMTNVGKTRTVDGNVPDETSSAAMIRNRMGNGEASSSEDQQRQPQSPQEQNQQPHQQQRSPQQQQQQRPQQRRQQLQQRRVPFHVQMQNNSRRQNPLYQSQQMQDHWQRQHPQYHSEQQQQQQPQQESQQQQLVFQHLGTEDDAIELLDSDEDDHDDSKKDDDDNNINVASATSNSNSNRNDNDVIGGDDRTRVVSSTAITSSPTSTDVVMENAAATGATGTATTNTNTMLMTNNATNTSTVTSITGPSMSETTGIGIATHRTSSVFSSSSPPVENNVYSQSMAGAQQYHHQHQQRPKQEVEGEKGRVTVTGSGRQEFGHHHQQQQDQRQHDRNDEWRCLQQNRPKAVNPENFVNLFDGFSDDDEEEEEEDDDNDAPGNPSSFLSSSRQSLSLSTAPPHWLRTKSAYKSSSSNSNTGTITGGIMPGKLPSTIRRLQDERRQKLLHHRASSGCSEKAFDNMIDLASFSDSSSEATDSCMYDGDGDSDDDTENTKNDHSCDEGKKGVVLRRSAREPKENGWSKFYREQEMISEQHLELLKHKKRKRSSNDTPVSHSERSKQSAVINSHTPRIRQQNLFPMETVPDMTDPFVSHGEDNIVVTGDTSDTTTNLRDIGYDQSMSLPLEPRTAEKETGVVVMPTVYRNRFTNAENLPGEEICVCRTDDDPSYPRQIYRFQIQVRKSNIKADCAGNGAFISFLGAFQRSIDSTPQDNTAHQMGALSHISGPIRPLLAYHPYGSTIRVWLRMQTRMGDITLNPDSWSTQSSYVDWNLEGRENESTCVSQQIDPSLYNREVHSIKSFQGSNEGCALIDVGLYGPRRIEERLNHHEYEIKTWLFQNLPSEYSFAVDGQCLRESRSIQAIDISDHATGKPHTVSQNSVPMYVNEGGYTSKAFVKKEPNTDICEREGKIFYVFRGGRILKSTAPSRAVELEVDYGPGYETQRERKGYGKRNLEGKVLDDTHAPSRLLRNIEDRRKILQDIEPLGIRQMYSLLEFLDLDINSRISELVRQFIAFLEESARAQFLNIKLTPGLSSPSISIHQILVLRRLHWLAPALREHIERLEEANATDRTEKALVEQCYHTIQEFERSLIIEDDSKPDLVLPRRLYWSDLLRYFDEHPELVDCNQVSFRDAYRQELQEEVLFPLRVSLRHPFEEGTWCPIACRLIDGLCNTVFETFHTDGQRSSSILAKAFLSLASATSEEIMNERTELTEFAFLSKTFHARYEGLFRGEEGTGDEKCILLYDPKNNPDDIPLVASLSEEIVQENNEGGVHQRVHKEWYLARQMLVVVDSFGKEFLSCNDYDNLQLELRARIETKARKQCLDVFFNQDFPPVDEHSEMAFGKPEPMKDITEKRKGWKKGQQILPSWASNSPRTSPLFYKVILPILERELGWTVEYGDPPWAREKRADGYHFCAFPPGVHRHEECSVFSPRVNYFASPKDVLHCLDQRFCHHPWARFCIALNRRYQKSLNLTIPEDDLVSHVRTLFDQWSRKEASKKGIIQEQIRY